MKASLKFRDSDACDDQPHLLLRAKLPVSVLGYPFSASTSAGSHPSDLSFRLTSSSSGGPSLALSYHPNGNPSCSLTLKSGLGLFGSPVDSPLVLSARFALPQHGRSPSSPAFFLHLRPRFGHFSLKRTLLSASSPSPSPLPPDAVQVGLLSGVSAVAQTEIPVAKSAAVRCRWGVNFPADSDKSLPFLTLEKISVERVEDSSNPATEAAAGNDNCLAKNGETEACKGMCASMGMELEGLRRENESIKASIRELRLATRGWKDAEDRAKKSPEAEQPGEFEKWRSRRRRGNGEVEAKKADDVEEELKRAIKATAP